MLRKRLRRSTIALVVLGVFGVTALETWESTIADRGSAIDLAGIQRARSIKLVREALELRWGEGTASALLETSAVWSAGQAELLGPAMAAPEPGRSLLERAAVHLAEVTDAARCLADAGCTDVDTYQRLVTAQAAFFPLQDGAVHALAEAEGRERTQGRVAGVVLFGVLALVLMLQARFVFEPAIRRTERVQGELVAARDEAQGLAEEREHRNRDLAQALARAEAATALRTRFVANVSHEVRTPLNGVLGATELLLDDPLSSEQRELATTALRSAKTLLGVVDQILDFSKLEQGSFELDARPFDPARLARQVAQAFTGPAEDKGIALSVDVPGDAVDPVCGDAERLGQVLTNLLTNALKFTQEGRVSIEVSATPAEGTQTHLRFWVRDTGCGIRDDLQERLFQPFQQLDGSNTRARGGTGLGLAIAGSSSSAWGGGSA